jgi:hypothetical protein
MKRVIGYVVSIVGIVFMAVGFGVFNLGLDFLEGVTGTYVAGFGILLIVVGVIMSMKGGSRRRIDSGKTEVPIYEGTGKNRKIVGYRKD